jgi:protoporphyrinogen oxidase
LRSASVLAGLKLSPFIPLYNRVTVGQFLKKTMGSNAWFGLWEGLLRKKFGKYAGNILAAFFWARIHKRTRGLGYPHGGFQTFVNHVSRLIVQNGGEIHIETPIQRIKKDKNVFVLSSKDKKVNFSLILSTVPTPILVRISQETLPETYIKRLSRLRYLSALSLISLSKQKLLPKTYWLNVGVGDIPLMGIIQHTNMVRSEHYNNNEIVYIPYYLEGNDPKLTMSKEEVAEFVSPHLKKINPQFNIASTKLYLFKEAYAQPIFDRLFIDNIPTLRTPVDNFYISNLDMTYPYDRGTNYAVKLGKEAAEEILKDL